jgi:hypothetical protein
LPPPKLGPRDWSPPPAMRGAKPRPRWQNPQTPHLHLSPIGWTGYTISWWRFMPSPLRRSWSAHTGTKPSQRLVRFGPREDGIGSPRHLPRHRWHHHHRPISYPGPRCGSRASASNPRLTDKLARGARARDLSTARETCTRMNTVMRTSTRGTTPHGLRRPKDVSAMTQPTI